MLMVSSVASRLDVTYSHVIVLAVEDLLRLDAFASNHSPVTKP